MRTLRINARFVTGPTLEVPGTFEQAPAKSTAEVLSALDASLARAKEIIGGLDDATAMSAWSLTKNGKTLTGLVGQSLQRWDVATGEALYPDTVDFLSARGEDVVPRHEVLGATGEDLHLPALLGHQVLGQLAGRLGPGLTVLTQDDPAFPESVPDVIDDRSLERSWRLDVTTVPTLLRMENGIEAGRRRIGWRLSTKRAG